MDFILLFFLQNLNKFFLNFIFIPFAREIAKLRLQLNRTVKVTQLHCRKGFNIILQKYATPNDGLRHAFFDELHYPISSYRYCILTQTEQVGHCMIAEKLIQATGSTTRCSPVVQPREIV